MKSRTLRNYPRYLFNFNAFATVGVEILPVHESTGREPMLLYGTVGSRDAAVEPTGTYLQRVL